MPLKAHERVQFFPTGESRTKQSFTAETDINDMVRRATAGEEIAQNAAIPAYGDFTNVQDYQTAFNMLQDAKNDFAKLPSAVRKACDNDPGKFIDLVYSPDGRAFLEDVGLVERKAPPGAPEPSDENDVQAAETAPTAPIQGGE